MLANFLVCVNKYQQYLSAETSLSPSSIHLQHSPSLSNSHEQGRTLELERERMEEGIEGGKGEEEEKHQHLFMDLINILNLLMLGIVC